MHQLEIQKLICLHCVSICNSCTIMQAHTPLSAETPTKSSGNTDQGLMKKLKGFDGLAMSIGNGDAESAEGGSRLPQRFETGTDSPPSKFSFKFCFSLA
jgi:plant G-box-binding factor